MKILENESLRLRNSFWIGGSCRLLAEPEEPAELADLVAGYHRRGVPVHILGGGTNTLFADAGFDGAVISTVRLKSIEIGAGGRVVAQAGASLAGVIRESIRAGFEGIEKLVGIPGTIGGAVFGNAGSATSWIGACVESVTLIAPDGRFVERQADEIGWAYRSSGLEGFVIARVALRLRPGRREQLEAAARDCIQRKNASQPLVAKSAGCVFRNPPGQAAARMIEAAGLKGLRVGGAAVSQRHSNFLVNEGDATARDVRVLMKMVRERVHERYGVQLVDELVFVGSPSEVGV